jgi:lantibiotic modifying enzyme
MGMNLVLTDILESTLTISEKRKFYYSESNAELINLKKWKNKKNLVTEEIFKEILEKNDMNEKEFDFCISPIKYPEHENFPKWLLKLEQILGLYDFETMNEVEVKDITLVLYPFVQYVANKLTEINWGNSEMAFSGAAIQDILTNYAREITSFIEKNIVIELEQYKTLHGFKSNDVAQQFIEFISQIVGDKDTYYSFFNKYAVSTRLITMRTMFFVENIMALVAALKESEQELLNVLQIEVGEIVHLELSVGDSHEKGKGVILVEFEKDKVVYKPKN